MKTLKQEEVDATIYRDIDDARAAIGPFIDKVYNVQRLHSALDYLTPHEYEEKLSRFRPGVPPAEIAITETCP